MFMSGLAILIVIAMGYVWLTRGFFSALIHLVCTVIAGAVAFAVWEHAAYFLIDFAPTSGFLSFLGGTAWGLGLALPFAITLALLRAGVDGVIRANVNPGTTANYIGGGVCGALAGVIAAGITVISIGFLRMETTFWGATHVGYADKGYIVRTGSGVGGLIFPVDKITTMIYGKLSQAAFRVDEPLAKYHPNLQEEPASLRLNAFEGKARNTTKPEDFSVTARYQVGYDKNIPIAQLLRDRWSPGPQEAKDLNGNEYPAGSYIEMFIVNFKAGAKEKDGKVAVGAGQIRLLLQSKTDENDRIELYPIAAASQADARETVAGRWRFDARETFIASVGGASEFPIGFEFVVPPGYEPIAMYVKGVRHMVSDAATAKPQRNFASTDERDRFIVNFAGGNNALPVQVGGGGGGSGGGGTVASGGGTGFDKSQAIKIGNGQPVKDDATYQPEGVRITHALPFTLQDGTFSGLEVSTEGTKYIIEGETSVGADYPDKTRGVEKTLRIDAFATNEDTNIVQIDVGANSKTSLLGQAAATAERTLPPLLWDTNGIQYQPVGFIYYDETKITIRFKPGEPITSLSQTPSMSKSRPKQKLTLIFRVSMGAKVDKFTVGKKVVAEYDPPFPCNIKQTR